MGLDGSLKKIPRGLHLWHFHFQWNMVLLTGCSSGKFPVSISLGHRVLRGVFVFPFGFQKRRWVIKAIIYSSLLCAASTDGGIRVLAHLEHNLRAYTPIS